MSVLTTDINLLASDAMRTASLRIAEKFTPSATTRDISVFTHPRVLALLNENKAVAQRSPEWFAERNTLLTASDVAAAIGQNPYQTRQELLTRKLHNRLGITSSATSMSKMGMIACEHGERYEDEAAREYFTRFPENGMLFSFGLIKHPTYTFLAGSPDRVTQNGILLEIKVRLKNCLGVRDVRDVRAVRAVRAVRCTVVFVGVAGCWWSPFC